MPDNLAIRKAQESIDRMSQPVGTEVQKSSLSCSLDELLEFLRLDGRELQNHEARSSMAMDEHPFQIKDLAVGRFRLIRELGQGGFGVVFLAFDPRLKRETALKIPRPELLMSPRWRTQILREARAVAMLDHPGIVPVYEVGRGTGICYIASAYCAGPSLAAWLAEQRSPMPYKLAAQWTIALAEAVQYAHSRGILHRDLKPANVLLLPEPTAEDHQTVSSTRYRPKLTDFGLAIRSTSRQKSANARRLIGTPAYMSPEQASGDVRQVGIATDIFGLGALLYHMLTGHAPFDGKSPTDILEAAQNGSFKLVGELRQDVPADLAAIIHKCLSRDPADRYQSAWQLAEDLNRFLTGYPVTARPVGAFKRMAQWSRRRPVLTLLTAGLIGMVAIGVGGIAWQWRRAEANLTLARAESVRAEQNLIQAEDTLLHLGRSIDENLFWREIDDDNLGTTLESAVHYFDFVLKQESARPHSPHLLATAHTYAAKAREQQGLHYEADREYRSSISHWQGILQQNVNDEAAKDALAHTCLWYGDFWASVRENPDGRCLIVEDRLWNVVDFVSPIGLLTVRCYADLLLYKGDAFYRKHDTIRAEQYYRSGTQLYDRIVSIYPEDPKAAVQNLRAFHAWSRIHSPGKSHSVLHAQRREVFLRGESLLKLHPGEIELYDLHSRLCYQMSDERFSEPVERRVMLLERSIELQQMRNEASDPVLMAHAWNRLGDLQQQTGQTDQAMSAYRQAISAIKNVTSKEIKRQIASTLSGRINYNLGQFYLERKNTDEALNSFQEAISSLDFALEVNKSRKQALILLLDSLIHAAKLYQDAGRFLEAQAAIDRGLELLTQRFPAKPRDVHIRQKLIALKKISESLHSNSVRLSDSEIQR